eukprot:CAMPEP_0185201990 /NCGR_PEP_ID=MMETSP1140-20130426/50280_1 /TAXON_ID=298111 /ORGANISM="Pavlova sp., Strain CCMP459" /LENGTH=77 /DNA_ID=CAMNT_0027769403 /DNA_START=26 /DNA_END=256 /DNA_ORIENTATION=-
MSFNHPCLEQMQRCALSRIQRRAPRRYCGSSIETSRGACAPRSRTRGRLTPTLGGDCGESAMCEAAASGGSSRVPVL